MTTERDLAERSFSSAAPWELIPELFEFPKEVKGLTILDVGAGASNATARLRRQGAQALAIDYQYRDLRGLRRDVNRYLTDRTYPFRKAGQPVDQEMLRVHQNVSVANPEYVRWSRSARDSFFEDVEFSKDRGYVAALAGTLPFPNNTFDFCFSLQGISRFLLQDSPVFLVAISECLRVLKPGRQLQLYPWVGRELWPWTEKEIQNAQQFMNWLENNKISYAMGVRPSLPSTLLHVSKPGEN